MASSTDEEENFFLLYKLIVVIGTKAVKDMFDQLFPPNKSCSPLSKFKSTLIGVLKPFEYKKVFPPGMPPSSSDEFDITLMVSLMRHIAPPNTSPIKITDTPPSPTDTSLAADLSRMKWYRNSLSHASRPEIIDASEFDKNWRLLSETISRIGGSVYKSQCDALKNSHIPMDERERLRRELNERRLFWSFLSTNGIEEMEVNYSAHAILNDKSLLEISKKLGTDWKELFLKLDMSLEEIKAIEHDHSKDIMKQAYLSLIQWRSAETKEKMEPNEIVDKLKKVLKGMKRGDLLELINKMVTGTITETSTRRKRPAKFENTDVVFLEKNLYRIAECLLTSWLEYLLHLGLTQNDIDNIKNRFPDDVKRQALEGMMQWINVAKSEDCVNDYIIEKMIEKLHEIHRQDIINLIMEMMGNIF